MKLLTMNEQILLVAILRLQNNAYGVTIRDQVHEMTGKQMVYGTLYNSLDKLVRKDYVVTQEGEPTRERGGRRKIYYSLTSLAKDALAHAGKVQSVLWNDETRLALKEKP